MDKISCPTFNHRSIGGSNKVIDVKFLWKKNRAPFANMILITKYALFNISSFWVKIWDELKMKKKQNQKTNLYL